MLLFLKRNRCPKCIRGRELQPSAKAIIGQAVTGSAITGSAVAGSAAAGTAITGSAVSHAGGSVYFEEAGARDQKEVEEWVNTS